MKSPNGGARAMLSRMSKTVYGGMRARSSRPRMSPGAMPAFFQWRWKNGISHPRSIVFAKRASCFARSSSREITRVVRN